MNAGSIKIVNKIIFFKTYFSLNVIQIKLNYYLTLTERLIIYII